MKQESLRSLDLSNYKHLSFDLWLTLIRSNPNFKQKRNHLFKDYFHLPQPIEQIEYVVRKFDVFCNSTNELTGLHIDTFEIYALILNELGCAQENLSLEHFKTFYVETERLFFENSPSFIFSNIWDELKYFRDLGIKMNILSNTGFIKGATLRKFLNEIELAANFDFQVYSDECRMSKPNPDIFALVFKEINLIHKVEKNEVCHIGDNLNSDIRGAKAFGFNAHHIK